MGRPAYGDQAYGPFGESYNVTGSSLNVFTGQTADMGIAAGSSPIYDFLFRQYSPAQGRWMVPDPSGIGAVDITNPQTWNRYAYLANNPLNKVDPLGLYCVYLDDSGTSAEEIDDDGDTSGCMQGGGYWIEGSANGGWYSINSNNGTVTGEGYDSNGNAEYSVAGAQGSNQWGAYTQTFNANTSVAVGQFLNTYGNPFGHAAISIGGGPWYGLGPKGGFGLHMAARITVPFYNAFNSGVPGVVETQDPSTEIVSVGTGITGAQAVQMQSVINASIQTPPNYDVFGPNTTWDCASWVQMVLSAGGVNSGPPAQTPSGLIANWPY